MTQSPKAEWTHDVDAFALGSSQYSGIYQEYRKALDNEKVKNSLFHPMVNYQDSLTVFFEEIIPGMGKVIIENAQEWGEEPDLQNWNSLDLKLRLLLAKESNPDELHKRMLLDFFNLLKNQAWDLWSALNFTNGAYPELSDFIEENFGGEAEDDIESNQAYGFMIYFFSVILKLNDDEVREIFGDFDT